MPPAISSGESDSDGDLIPAKKASPRSTSKSASKASAKEVEEEEDVEMVQASASDNDDDEEEGEEEEEGYEVEAIKDHKFINSTLHYHVKWKGYEKKSDMTWEPAANCATAKDVVDEYHKSIGGVPEQGKKRSRPSGTPGSKSAKKARRSIGSTRNTAASESPAPAPKKKAFQPPEGSWEDHVHVIDTIEKGNDGLMVFVQWKVGEKGRYPITLMYEKCPQRMLDFYEQHLVFKESGTL